MLKFIQGIWDKMQGNSPESHTFYAAFKRLEDEKRKHWYSDEYWRIWEEEVHPAYRALSETIPKVLWHPDTELILRNMGKRPKKAKYKEEL